MVRRDMAEYLLSHGARIDLFAAAVLGNLAIDKAALSNYPQALKRERAARHPTRGACQSGRAGRRRRAEFRQSLGAS